MKEERTLMDETTQNVLALLNTRHVISAKSIKLETAEQAEAIETLYKTISRTDLTESRKHEIMQKAILAVKPLLVKVIHDTNFSGVTDKIVRAALKEESEKTSPDASVQNDLRALQKLPSGHSCTPAQLEQRVNLCIKQEQALRIGTAATGEAAREHVKQEVTIPFTNLKRNREKALAEFGPGDEAEKVAQLFNKTINAPFLTSTMGGPSSIALATVLAKKIGPEAQVIHDYPGREESASLSALETACRSEKSVKAIRKAYDTKFTPQKERIQDEICKNAANFCISLHSSVKKNALDAFHVVEGALGTLEKTAMYLRDDQKPIHSRVKLLSTIMVSQVTAVKDAADTANQVLANLHAEMIQPNLDEFKLQDKAEQLSALRAKLNDPEAGEADRIMAAEDIHELLKEIVTLKESYIRNEIHSVRENIKDYVEHKHALEPELEQKIEALDELYGQLLAVDVKVADKNKIVDQIHDLISEIENSPAYQTVLRVNNPAATQPTQSIREQLQAQKHRSDSATQPAQEKEEASEYFTNPKNHPG